MTTWKDVARTLVAAWPSQRWDRDQIAGYIQELEVRNLSPEQAMTGLRASRSDFVPSAGRTLELYLESRPPATPEQIERAVARVRERELNTRHLRAIEGGEAVEER